MYNAPECAALGRSTPAADVWAFGVLALELAFGVPLADLAAAVRAGLGPIAIASSAHGAAPAAEWSATCMELALALLPLLPATISGWLMECLSVVPEQRPSFRALAAHLLGAMERARSEVACSE